MEKPKKTYDYPVKITDITLKKRNTLEVRVEGITQPVSNIFSILKGEAIRLSISTGQEYIGTFSISCPVPEEEGPGSLETMSYELEVLKDKTGKIVYKK